MSTYYTGSDNQSDAAPMMYMRESSPGSYAEAPVLPGTMMMHMNSSSFAVNPQLQPSNCIEIQAVEASDLTSQQQEILSSLDGSRFAEHDFGAWRDGRNEMLSMHPMVGTANILHNGLNLQGQGLSLSLGTQMPFGIQMPSIPHRNPYSGFASFLIRNPSLPSRDEQSRNADYLPHGFAGANQDSYGMSGMSRTIPNSKYVKAAQELLNEVVNVPKAVKQPDCEKNQNSQDNWTKSYKEDGESKNVASTQQDSAQKNGLSHAERQELQSKLTKLLYMLDEVGRRYKQYHHQMQIVVSSFNVIAGCGAAKPYTAVALQTISRHFRCLKDAINDQIRATRKSLGDQDASENGKGVGITRLRYVEKQLRQQKALQQLGLMQPHAWRPQRGLPENSVSILRAWLFEHFLHPYPKDSEKIMLARQTGLTRSQVSNWFINARVRLWKPMVEEMYKEEFADLEMDSISSSENAVKARKGDTRTSKDRGEDLQQSGSSSTTERCSAGELVYSNSDCVLDVDIAGSTTRASFQYVTHGDAETDYGLLSQRTNQKPNADDSNIFPNAITHSDSTNAITYSDSASGRFTKAATASYHMKALGSFGSGSSISLSLGLQHCEEGSIPISGGSHQNFIAMKADDIYNPATSSVGAETTDIEYINPSTRQNSFGSSRMLHDFVA